MGPTRARIGAGVAGTRRQGPRPAPLYQRCGAGNPAPVSSDRADRPAAGPGSGSGSACSAKGYGCVPEPLCYRARSPLVRRTGSLPARTLARARNRAPALCLVSVWGRSALLHRRALRHHGAHAGRGDDRGEMAAPAGNAGAAPGPLASYLEAAGCGTDDACGGDSSMTVPDARDAAPWVERLARVGYAAKALLYITIGILAAQ